MPKRLREPTAFRADPTAAAARPSRRQAVAVLAILAAVAGAVTAASYLVQPSEARSFDLFHGSVFLADSVAPVGIDLASGKPTVRLADANAQVGAKQAADLGVVPAADGTLLLNRRTGEFNMVDATGFVVKPNGGVAVESRRGATSTNAVAAKDFAYIVQSGPTGTSMFVVGASTVAGASADGRSVQPRASLSIDEPVLPEPGSTASAGNDLWALVGAGETRRIRHLGLPADSDPGVLLDSTDRGSVRGPAALASAKANSADPDEPTVVLASADRLTIYNADGGSETLRFPRPVAGLKTVLPSTGNDDRVSFLLQGSDGWFETSVRIDGSDMQNPAPIRDIPGDARLIPPASSRGGLYTLEADRGRLFRIDDGRASSVDGMAEYPLTRQRGTAIEKRYGFGDSSAIARGPRVVLNSPSHGKAVVLFTDGSRKPLAVEKGDAVVVSAAGGAEALTRSRAQKPGRTPKPVKGTSSRKPAAPVNNSIQCETTSQRPHIPLLGQPQPGSRSVLLAWTYPITGQDDCVPQTYVVNVERLSNSGPTPPGHVRVDGQRSVNLSGLYPSTRYEVSVTAYINGRGTESAKIPVTTGPEGPTAPRNVTAVADASGNWRIDWGSCGAAKSGCVTAESWRVIPQFCDARGLSQAPSALEIPADPTSTTQPGTTLRGGTALLGRGLSFQVEGIGASGEIGSPSSATPCVTSWKPPTASAMSLTASRPDDVPVNQPATTTVSLDLGSSPVSAVGGVGASLTFSLIGPSGTSTREVTYDGRSSAPSVSFPNVRAGSTYRASVSVAPPQHPGSAVGVGPVEVVGRNTWPKLGVSVTCPKSGLLTCTLNVNVFGISSSDIGGGKFDLVDSSLRCGNVSRAIERSNFDPANTTITVANVTQTDKFYGDCSVQVGLTESSVAGGADHPYFGAAQSPRPTASVSLGDPTHASAGAGDFSADWSTRSGSSAKLTYNGNESLDVLTDSWSETLVAPDDSTNCGSAQSQPSASDPVYVAATQNCIDKFGDGARTWHVDVSYRNRSDGTPKSFRVDLVGAPPSYQPCDPSGPSAAWGATKADGVTVRAEGDLAGCSNWTYELRTSTGDVCNRVTDGGAPTITIAIPSDCTAEPNENWTVAVTWKRPNGDTDAFNPPIAVGGSPPTS